MTDEEKEAEILENLEFEWSVEEYGRSEGCADGKINSNGECLVQFNYDYEAKKYCEEQSEYFGLVCQGVEQLPNGKFQAFQTIARVAKNKKIY